MSNEVKKTAYDVMPQAANESVMSDCADASILPRDPLNCVVSDSSDKVGTIASFEAPSGNEFIIGRDGLQVVVGDKSPIKLCSYIDVIAEGYSVKGGGRCRIVRFTDTFGNERESVIMMADIVKNQNTVLAVLVDQGLTLYRANAQGGNGHVAEFIRTKDVERRFMTVDAYGWVRLGEEFIIPNATIGSTKEREIVFNGDAEGAPIYDHAGTLEQWQNTIGMNAKYSSRVAFAVCMAFASPLLKFTTEPSGGFHLVGESGTGKSTALRALCSVWAQVLEGGGEMSPKWNATANGIENAAKNHSDLPLILDELGQGENGKLNVEQVLYMLGNGAGKGRMKQDSKARALNVWRLLFMSAGERTAADMMERLRKDIATGANVRMATIEACPEGGFGVFETLPRGMTAKELAMAFSEDGSKYYGTAGIAFMKAFIDDVKRRGGVSAMSVYIKECVKQWTDVHTKNYDSLIQRVANRFALVAVAGELAIEYGVLPWDTGDASKFAVTCFNSFADSFETPEKKQVRMCEDILDFVRANPRSFSFVVPPSTILNKAETGGATYGSIIYSLSSVEGVLGDPVIIFFNKVGLTQAGGGKFKDAKRALHNQGWLYVNDKKNLRYKACKVIEVAGIPVTTAYIVIPPGGYPEEVREVVAKTILAEHKVQNLGKTLKSV